MEVILIKKDWDYTLYKKNNQYFLEVICGSVALFEIKIQLNEEEISNYLEKGEVYIEEMARTIQENPSKWKERTIAK